MAKINEPSKTGQSNPANTRQQQVGAESPESKLSPPSSPDSLDAPVGTGKQGPHRNTTVVSNTNKSLTIAKPRLVFASDKVDHSSFTPVSTTEDFARFCDTEFRRGLPTVVVVQRHDMTAQNKSDKDMQFKGSDCLLFTQFTDDEGDFDLEKFNRTKNIDVQVFFGGDARSGQSVNLRKLRANAGAAEITESLLCLNAYKIADEFHGCENIALTAAALASGSFGFKNAADANTMLSKMIPRASALGLHRAFASAIRFGNLELVATLLSWNLDPNKTLADDYRSPLQAATHRNLPEIAALLRNHGAKDDTF